MKKENPPEKAGTNSDLYSKKYSEVVVQSSDFLINKKKIFDIINREIPEKEGLSILEVGCNQGGFVREIQKKHPNTHGIDINNSAVEMIALPNIQSMDATNTDFESNQMDVILSSHVLEHISDAPALFREMERLLKPGGRIIFVYPFELFRGMAALRTSWQTYGTPFRAGELHVILYYPRKIKTLISGSRLVHIKSRLFFANTPQWLTVLSKS